MVICLTVLSLQQLLDAGQYQYRFLVLRKLGVEEQHINKLILKQLGVWFGLPVIVAIVVAAVVIGYFIQTISAEISAYIGFTALMLQIGLQWESWQFCCFAILSAHGLSFGVLFIHSVAVLYL